MDQAASWPIREVVIFRLAADSVWDVKSREKRMELVLLEKPWLGFGMSLNYDIGAGNLTKWEECQLFSNLQETFVKHNNHFHGEPLWMTWVILI